MPIEQLSTKKKVGRKRTRNPDSWKCNVNKKRRQAGQEYKSRNKVIRRKREINNEKDCTNCKFKCHIYFPQEQRELLFNKFWGLSDDLKAHFYSENTTRIVKKTKRTLAISSRRQYSFAYFFHLAGIPIRVCKPFFLNTLDISQQRISYFYKHFQTDTNTPTPRKQGKHTKKKIPDAVRDGVRKHIYSIPVIDSHYCRANTNRKYFESESSISRLYELYQDFCQQKRFQPAKKHLYSEIFLTEFNISFQQRKKDRCDKCETFKIKSAEGILSDCERAQHLSHIEQKEDAREERKKDRQSGHPVLCFDLQNVLTVPKAEISNFFYLRKLSVYNMTAHLSLDKDVYCCIWSESQSGRAGNDLASAILRILESVLTTHPQLKNLILWSDSCVPQNRNSIMSTAIKHFLNAHPDVESITQKFSASGHGCVQEVDAVHSSIDQKLKKTEVYSPLGLIRILKSVRRQKPFNILQMKDVDFLNIQAGAKSYNFTKVPFTQVKQLKYYSNHPFTVSFKTKHADGFTSVFAGAQSLRKKKSTAYPITAPKLSIQTKKSHLLSKEKNEDIKKMMPYMPEIDRNYMATLCV